MVKELHSFILVHNEYCFLARSSLSPLCKNTIKDNVSHFNRVQQEKWNQLPSHLIFTSDCLERPPQLQQITVATFVKDKVDIPTAQTSIRTLPPAFCPFFARHSCR